MKSVCVLTNGCPENRNDCAKMQELLRRNGWALTDDIGGADLVLFNACGLTEYNQEASIHKICELNSLKQASAKLIVCGCLTRINPKRLQEVYAGPTFGSDEIDKLIEVVGAKDSSNHIDPNYIIDCSSCGPDFWWKSRRISDYLNPYYILARVIDGPYYKLYNFADIVSPNHFYIKVATGCLSRCAYCAVKISRGNLKSKPIDDILSEFRAGLAAGHKEFALLGSDLGCYGRDRGNDLVELLQAMAAEKGDYKLKLRNVHPRFMIDMLPGLKEVFKSGKVGLIISAAQSGNDRILECMHRGYKIKDFVNAIRALKNAAPKLQVRSQIMVGFPGETEEEFNDSLRLLDEVDFDFVEIYQFSPRPGTPAEKFTDRVPTGVILKRYYKMLKKFVGQLETRNGLLANRSASANSLKSCCINK